MNDLLSVSKQASAPHIPAFSKEERSRGFVHPSTCTTHELCVSPPTASCPKPLLSLCYTQGPPAFLYTVLVKCLLLHHHQAHFVFSLIAYVKMATMKCLRVARDSFAARDCVDRNISVYQ